MQVQAIKSPSLHAVQLLSGAYATGGNKGACNIHCLPSVITIDI